MQDGGELILKGDRVERVLVEVHGVALLLVPPPRLEDPLDTNDWSVESKVWVGTIKLVQSEYCGQMPSDEELVFGMLVLVNPSNGEVVVEVRCNWRADNISVTRSKRLYRVIIQYDDKRIGFGLAFGDNDSAMRFSMGLADFKNEAQLIMTTNTEDDDNDDYLATHMSVLDLKNTHDEVQSDDDFGDFVSS